MSSFEKMRWVIKCFGLLLLEGVSFEGWFLNESTSMKSSEKELYSSVKGVIKVEKI